MKNLFNKNLRFVCRIGLHSCFGATIGGKDYAVCRHCDKWIEL